ncbi:MAG: isoleucine--tRNA ligase [Myxococcales bacterium]|nr:isoleucine--tRNA ligase [Myxococcales bacterium]
MASDPYSSTLLLPRSVLPARASLSRREPRTLQRWRGRELVEEMTRDPDRAGTFVLHDGPPYANGPVHLGHVFNKCLKDFAVRSQAMAGRRVSWTLGWDCHGLPVQRAVVADQPELAESDPLALRAACRSWAVRWQQHQRTRFERMLALVGPGAYRTLDPGYEADALELFADLVDQDLVVRAHKPVRWSLGNHTALAEAELVYADRTDPSVWVDFAAADPQAVHARFGRDDASPVAWTAWTTTPWTLPANVALAVNPEHAYALVQCGSQLRVVAAQAVASLAAAMGRSCTVVATVAGASLLGLRYRPVLATSASPAALRVVAGAHVTADEGTGVVHTAPGHGPEDHEVGLREGLPCVSVLDDRGTLCAPAPVALQGLSVHEANAWVVGALTDRGELAASASLTHAVALDARGFARVVYRATPQWFVALDRPTRAGPTLRQAALDALDEVRFTPASSRRRLQSMLAQRPDWCVSRQRPWGLPLPAFHDAEGGTLLTPATARAVARVVRQRGSDVWFRGSAAELLAGSDVDASGFSPGPDVLDVWFEAGASWWSVLRGGVADLVVEGSDQHRGWFQASLLLSVARAGRAPFRQVLTHGFVVDKHGRKYAKSKRNAPDVDALVDKRGAEVLRWWVATCRPEADVKADGSLFATAASAFRKVRSTLRFVVGNVVDAGPVVRTPPSPEPTAPEAWLLAAYGELVSDVRAAYAEHAYAVAARALHAFCADVLSARFLAASKDRLYCDAAHSPRRVRAQRALWHVAEGVSRLLAPLLPHTADEVWRALHDCSDDPVATVHAALFPEVPSGHAHPAWERASELRREAAVALQAVRAQGGPSDPLDVGLRVPDDGTLAALELVDLADWCGVSRVGLVDPAATLQVVDLRDQPRCERSRRRTADVRQRASGAWLSDRDAAVIRSS